MRLVCENSFKKVLVEGFRSRLVTAISSEVIAWGRLPPSFLPCKSRVAKKTTTAGSTDVGTFFCLIHIAPFCRNHHKHPTEVKIMQMLCITDKLQPMSGLSRRVCSGSVGYGAESSRVPICSAEPCWQNAAQVSDLAQRHMTIGASRPGRLTKPAKRFALSQPF